MPRSVAFVEEPGRVTIDKRGVIITYDSGGETFVRRMAIEDFRSFVAHAQTLLQEYDRRARERVVALPKPKRS